MASRPRSPRSTPASRHTRERGKGGQGSNPVQSGEKSPAQKVYPCPEEGCTAIFTRKAKRNKHVKEGHCAVGKTGNVVPTACAQEGVKAPGLVPQARAEPMTEFLTLVSTPPAAAKFYHEHFSSVSKRDRGQFLRQLREHLESDETYQPLVCETVFQLVSDCGAVLLAEQV